MFLVHFLEIFWKKSKLVCRKSICGVNDEIICSVNDSLCHFTDLVRESLAFSICLFLEALSVWLFILALQFKWLRVRHVNMVGNFLLANMTILFLPPAVGIMEKFDVIAPYLLPIVLIIFFCSSHQYYPHSLGSSVYQTTVWRRLWERRCQMSEFVSNPLFGLALSILAYLVGMLIYRRFSPSIDNALAFVSCFHYHLSKGDGGFLTKITTRVGFIWTTWLSHRPWL